MDAAAAARNTWCNRELQLTPVAVLTCENGRCAAYPPLCCTPIGAQFCVIHARLSARINALLEVTSVSTENELFSAVDALLEQVAQDDLPVPAERR